MVCVVMRKDWVILDVCHKSKHATRVTYGTISTSLIGIASRSTSPRILARPSRWKILTRQQRKKKRRKQAEKKSTKQVIKKRTIGSGCFIIFMGQPHKGKMHWVSIARGLVCGVIALELRSIGSMWHGVSHAKNKMITVSVDTWNLSHIDSSRVSVHGMRCHAQRLSHIGRLS